jgi:hypothetical protein
MNSSFTMRYPVMAALCCALPMCSAALLHADDVATGVGSRADEAYSLPRPTGDELLHQAGAPFVLIAAPFREARQGDTVVIPITVVANQEARDAGVTEATLILSFNTTLLGPVGTTPPGTTRRGQRETGVFISLSRTADTTVRLLTYVAGLGNDSATVLAIDTTWTNVPGVPIGEGEGNFRLLDLCLEGGPRLMNPEGEVGVGKARPNPLSDHVTLDLDLIESGPTTITLHDATGAVVRTFVDGPLPVGRQELPLDMSDIPIGRYMIIVRTPTVRRLQQVEVVR